MISQRVVDECGLQPIGMETICSVHGLKSVPKYLVTIILPNQVGMAVVEVTLGILGNIDVLVGMDIIQLGDFSLTNCNGHTCFSFRMPSQGCTDFTSQEE